jgi:DNA-binding MarR family transcriptional regulator
MPNSSLSKPALARRVWVAMFDFLMRTSPERAKSLGRRGLTPNDSRALAILDAEKGRTMRSLADAWECDASNATWVVDRLESLGLAERRTVPEDRRVKLVVLTAKGRKTKAELMEEFLAPPSELLTLDRDDLEALHRLLAKLPAPQTASTTARRRHR